MDNKVEIKSVIREVLEDMEKEKVISQINPLKEKLKQEFMELKIIMITFTLLLIYFIAKSIKIVIYKGKLQLYKDLLNRSLLPITIFACVSIFLLIIMFIVLTKCNRLDTKILEDISSKDFNEISDDDLEMIEEIFRKRKMC